LEEESVIHKFLPVLTRWVLFGVTVFFAVSGFMPREEQNKIRPVMGNIVCEPCIFPSTPVRSYSDTKESTLHQIIIQAASRHKVDPALVKAIIRAESGYNPMAVSKKGAMGLMQLMPRTAEALGVEDEDIFNPENNIDAGVKYLKQLLTQFHGNVRLAVAAYNAGTKKVRKYKDIPPYKATRHYVNKVLEYYQYYKKQLV
jgi:soluble lytic murein transglycosylase-like protein